MKIFHIVSLNQLDHFSEFQNNKLINILESFEKEDSFYKCVNNFIDTLNFDIQMTVRKIRKKKLIKMI